MSEVNTKRSIWSIHGFTGVLISLVGLIVILIVLQLMVIVAQRNAVPYDPAPIRDINNLKMISVENKQFAFQPATKDSK
jgi:hypothetical protein